MSWQPGFKPMGAPGGRKASPLVVGQQPKKSAVKWIAKAAYQHRQNRTALDRDVSAARRAWVIDHIYGASVFLLLLILMVGGTSVWLLGLVVVIAVVVARIPVVRIPLQRRIKRRQLARAWEGDERKSGIAQGVGLVSAGQLPGVVGIVWDGQGDMLMDLRLVPGITLKTFVSKSEEIRSAFGAAYVGFEQINHDTLRLALRSRDPLDGAVEAGWASTVKPPVSMPVEVMDGVPWWESAQSSGEEKES